MLPVNKNNLAGLLAITPAHFSRKLTQLEKMGIIRRSEDWVYVQNLESLSREAA